MRSSAHPAGGVAAAPCRLAACLLAAAVCSAATAGAGYTIGVLQDDPGTSDDLGLFNALTNDVTYLVNRQGRIVNSWQAANVIGNTAYLVENGKLLRTADPGSTFFLAGGDAGLVEIYSWEGVLEWSYLYSDASVRAHHDVAYLPNGNVLILAWELKTGPESIQAGRDPASMVDGELWPEHVVEVMPTGATTGTIVWEWHVWDHLIQDFDAAKDNFGVVGDHPELIDINFTPNGRDDWLHANALDYNADLDQVLIGTPRFSEVWIIDHSTTTAEAAGHTGGDAGRGGDLLYRWGNPQTYDRGTSTDQQLYGQHSPHWIPSGRPGAGNILVYNNGNGRPAGQFSTVEEIVPPVLPDGTYTAPLAGQAYLPAAPTWIFTATPPTSLYSGGLSSGQRLANGNTVVCSGQAGLTWEITTLGVILWQYENPVRGTGPMTQFDPPLDNRLFRFEKYAQSDPVFAGRDLTPGPPVELYPADADGDGFVAVSDLLLVLADWGVCPGCLGDVNDDGVVDVQDLLDVLAQWTP